MKGISEEKWLPVVGYENFYEVSDKGRIRKVSSEIIGQWSNDQGYMLVRLSNPRKMLRVHRIVAAAFICNPYNFTTVNHIDFNTKNNSVANLEWCTQKDNLRHSDIAGRMQKDYWTGKRSPNAKLTNDQAESIRRDYSSGNISLSHVADKYGTNKRTAHRIIKNEIYL